jgi:hypothetical protein
VKHRPLHTVVETEAYLTRCGSASSIKSLPIHPQAISYAVRGGVRKVRYGGSGGHRIMVAYLGGTVPVYLLSILAKGQ